MRSSSTSSSVSRTPLDAESAGAEASEADCCSPASLVRRARDLLACALVRFVAANFSSQVDPTRARMGVRIVNPGPVFYRLLHRHSFEALSRSAAQTRDSLFSLV